MIAKICVKEAKTLIFERTFLKLATNRFKAGQLKLNQHIKGQNDNTAGQKETFVSQNSFAVKHRGLQFTQILVGQFVHAQNANMTHKKNSA